MFAIQLTLYWQVIVAVAVMLLVASWAFNEWIDRREEHTNGMTAWLVVIGVLYTLVGAAIVFWPAALIVACCFLCSGPLMIWGEQRRALRRHQRLIEKERQDLIDGPKA